MRSNGAQHGAVRLPAYQGVPVPATRLSPVVVPRIVLSSRSSHNTALLASTPTRLTTSRAQRNEEPRVVRVSEHHKRSSFSRDEDAGDHMPRLGFFSSGFMQKFATLMLVPMLLVYPIAPLYASEEGAPTDAGAPSEAPAAPAPEAAASVEAPVVDDVPVTDASTALPAALPSDTPPDQQDAVMTESEVPAEEIPSTEAGNDASAVTTDETPPDTPDEIPAAEDPSDDPVGGSDNGATEGETGTSSPEEVVLSEGGSQGETQGGGGSVSVPDGSASTTIAEFSSSTTPLTASSSDETASSTSDETASSTETVAVEEELTEETPVLISESPEAISSRLVSEKEGMLRNQLRQEVESEFTKGCVMIDAVGYYCLKDPTSQVNDSLAPSQVVTSVSSQTDGAGTAKQIFMTKGGVTTALTHDTWDNTFPTTDVSGVSIVWQGNVDGRWQIFFADASGTGTPEIIPLTHSSESNFNPRVDGNDVVWQGWINGNWEIMYATRLDPASYPPLDAPLPPENTRLGIDRTWSVKQITTNDVHDMFPSVAGGLITWQSFQDGSWNVFAYSMKTGVMSKLSRDGAKSENPRFAITWEERDASGESRMVGYDIATGKTVDITNEARQLPDHQPYQPQAPISQPDQAALPVTSSTSTSTSSRDDGGDGNTDNGLGI